jgi:prolyl oligopeptidase
MTHTFGLKRPKALKHWLGSKPRTPRQLIFDRPDNIPFPNRRGEKLFNPWQDAEHPRGLWRTTSFESFQSESPEWDVLIDLDKLAAKEGEDWVWRGGVSLPGAHDRAIVHLSRGGKDAVVLREFDLITREFVADGFNLPEARSQIVWLDRDTLLLISPLGPNMATVGSEEAPIEGLASVRRSNGTCSFPAFHFHEWLHES